MKITKRKVSELFGLFETIKKLCDDPNKKYSSKFSYGIALNKIKIKNEIDALAVIENEINNILQPYKQAINSKIIELGERDSAGGYRIREDDEEKKQIIFDYDKQLREQYKDLFEKQNIKMAEYSNILAEDVEFDFYKINFEYIPDDFITPGMIELLLEVGIVE